MSCKRPISSADLDFRGQFCSICNKRLAAGAKFCTRCGASVRSHLSESSATAFISGNASARASLDELASVVAGAGQRAARKKRPDFLAIAIPLIVTACFIGMVVRTFCTVTDSVSVSSSGAPVATQAPLPAVSLPIPPAPEMGKPLPPGNRYMEYAAISAAWVETDATDASGNYGIRVHAVVSVSSATGIRFVAHLNSMDTGPIRSVDPRFADVDGKVALATVFDGPLVKDGVIVLEGLPPAIGANISAFIPLSTMALTSGDERLQLTTALFDDQNRAVATGFPTPFNLPHGKLLITRARVDDSAQGDGSRAIKIDLRAPDRGSDINGRVIVVFKDAKGNQLSGYEPYANAAGELTSDAEFRIPAGPGIYPLNVEVKIPANVPHPAIAEIRLFDPRAGTWLTPPARLLVP